MQALHENLPAADFQRPDGVINMTICAETHDIANEYCEETLNVLLIKDSPANPSQVCELHDAKSKRKKDQEKEQEGDQPIRVITPEEDEESRGFGP